jgi:WD40 repeat protein
MNEPITSLTASRLQRVARLSISPMYDAVWMPDGATFAAALENGVWLQDTMQEHKPRRVTRDKDVAAIACDPRGSLLAVGSALTVWVIDSLTGARKTELSVNEGIEIRHLTFSPDGRWLASSDDGSVVVADLSRDRAQRLPGGSGGPAAWSGDGRILAYPTFEKGADGAIELWDRETETVQRSIEVDVITLEALLRVGSAGPAVMLENRWRNRLLHAGLLRRDLA